MSRLLYDEGSGIYPKSSSPPGNVRVKIEKSTGEAVSSQNIYQRATVKEKEEGKKLMDDEGKTMGLLTNGRRVDFQAGCV